MAKYDGHTRARNLPQDVQRWAVEASDPGVKCMTKDELRRRRLEGRELHHRHGCPPNVQAELYATIAQAMGLPLRYLTGMENLAVSEFFGTLDRITQPVESDDALRNRVRVCWHMDVFSRVSRQEMETTTGHALDDIARLYDLRRGPASDPWPSARYAK